MPWSEEAEAHVLACSMIDDGQTFSRVLAAGVCADTFWGAAQKTVFGAMLSLRSAGAPLSVETVFEELQRQRLAEAVGGIQFLMRVAGVTTTTLQAMYFVDRLLELAARREMIVEAKRIEEAAYSYTGGGLDTYEPLVTGVQRLERVKARSKSELPPVLGWREFVPKEQTPLPEELVEGVLHRGAKMMIAGGSKSFKTWVLLHLGLAVASGSPWWGMRVKRGPVLYVNLELARGFCEVRVRQICAAMKIESAEGFDSWHLRGFARDFKELLPHFITATALGQYALIILDPVYKILGERDENANGEVAQLLNEFEALAVRTGAAIAYGHHHSKGNQSEKDARDRSSGAGAWTRDPDALIDMTPHEEDEHFTATFTLRNCPPKSPMVVRWEFPVMSFAPGVDPTALRKPGRPKTAAIADIAVLLMGREPGLTYGEWEAAAMKKGVSESTFKRLRAQALKEGKVEQACGVYRLTQ